MANLNKVFLIGRLTRDPETRNLPSGTAVVNFGLAVNRVYYKRDSNEKSEETCFVDVEAWGRQGETIARYLKKGRPIFVEGRLRFDSWESQGQKRSRLSVVVENFQFLDGGSGGGSAEGVGEMGSGETGSADMGGEEPGGQRRSGSRDPGARAGRGAPVGARETPQDDYADDIPF
jgi:single-strand DNA-binding protein